MKPAPVTFPYRIQPTRARVLRLRPWAQVLVRSANQSDWWPLNLHIDTGAEITVLRRSDAIELGIPLESGEFAIIHGVGGGEVDSYVHRVLMRLGEAEFPCEIAFTTTDAEPRLLGRKDVFMQFKVCFDDVAQITEFHSHAQGAIE